MEDSDTYIDTYRYFTMFIRSDLSTTRKCELVGQAGVLVGAVEEREDRNCFCDDTPDPKVVIAPLSALNEIAADESVKRDYLTSDNLGYTGICLSVMEGHECEEVIAKFGLKEVE